MSYYVNSPNHDPVTSGSSNHYEPITSSCYFCNESMASKYLAEHVLHCGAVLEECPASCGAYVARCELPDHLSQCHHTSNGTETLDERIRSLQESAWKNKVVSVLSLLRSAVHDGEREIKELRDTLATSLQLTNEALRKDILEELFEGRRKANAMNARLNAVEKSCTDVQRRTVECVQMTNKQIDELKFEAASEQHRSIEEREKCYAVLEEMKASFTAESATICRLWQEQVQNIHDMRLELEMRCKLSKELVDKYNLLFDKMEALEVKVQKQGEVLSQQESRWKTLKFQMKQNVEYIEDILGDARGNNVIPKRHNECCNNLATGRLLWRIDQFSSKLEDAKQHDTVLYSPRFLDREYGYALRMELRLNGLGQWRNRHVIGCLRIVDGPWDPLLEWPRVLAADVILRDQGNPPQDLKKFVKTAKSKKGGERKRKDEREEEEEHSSDLYMFIPHTTLTKHEGYTKDDVMFLEIRVREIKFTGSTMSLV